MSNEGAVLILGATGGIGGAILDALRSRQAGPIVATYNRTPPPPAREIEWTKFDATAHGQEDALSTVIERHAGSLRAAFFCIGIPSSKRIIAETPADEWMELFAANCLSFVQAYTGIKDLARRSRSRIVVLSSDTTRALKARNGPYSASKAALEAAAQTLAKEEAEFGVRINILAPSLVDSPLADRLLKIKGITDNESYLAALPWGRMITLSEVSEAAVSLALDSHWEYATGQIFRLGSIE